MGASCSRARYSSLLYTQDLYHVRLNSYTLEEGRQRAAGAEGRRKRKV
ncbi:MAG: hypothetical protein F6K39_25495 [Okeania sp. SIO3B3]|nr:hypothetical protein [Okeania sp. SIO3B3]